MLRTLYFFCLLGTFLNAQSINLSRLVPITSTVDLGDAQTDEFPRPDILLPNIAFWKRIYGELTSNQIVFSDYDDLSLVYMIMNVPAGGKAREQMIKKGKQELIAVLKELDACQPESADDLKGLAKQVYLAIEDNPRKDKYKRIQNIRAQNGLKDQFEEGYRRSGAHEQEIKARLRNAGLPEELIGIVFVESLFHPKSRSSVGAMGIWQFMKNTAHEFMRVNQLVDERQDPIVSTEAAIRYIKSAKKSLKEWPLVITSYNYGRGGMAKAVEMTQSDDFEVILKDYENPRFGFAARNYYAEFLAAVDIYKQADQIFPEVEPVSRWAYEIIELPRAISVHDLLSTKSIEAVWLKTYNPALTKYAHDGRQILPKGFTLRVPSEERAKLEKRLAYLPERKEKRSRRRSSTCHFTELPAAIID
ncbi:MAG: lytic transglycosylase domain-containing protein [Myxococcaceae bacterium]